MYYPGLFETASPYSGLNARQFKADGLNSVEQHAELCSLVDKKNMVSNLSTSSLANTSLSLASSFRAAHFTAPHYRSQTSTADLMPQPYVSTSATHLSSSESLGSNMLHEQSFLEASTPYGIGPLSSYSHYPQYLGNPVINSTLKGPNGSTYSSHNSFYPSSAPPYPSLYPDSFISEYITRNHIDANKSAYNSTSDNSSFLEHLKRLQESFQSKSPKFADSSNQVSLSTNHASNVPQCTYTSNNQPVRPEPISMQVCPSGSKSPVIYSNQHYSNVDNPSSFTCSNTVSASSVTVSTASTSKSSSKESNNRTDCDLTNSSSVPPWNSYLCRPKSPISNHVQNDSFQQQLLDSHPVSNSKRSLEQSTCPSTLDLPSEKTEKVPLKGTNVNGMLSDRKKSKANVNESTISANAKDNEHGHLTVAPKPKPKQKPKTKQSQAKPNRNRSDECGQCEQTGPKKIKKRCRHQLWHPEHAKNDGEKSRSIEMPTLQKKEGKVSKAKKAEKPNTPQETKTTKKSNGGGRRRRFRSGLDMIRSSRKKPPSKAKLTNSTKKDNVKKNTKKDITMKDLRFESKRLIVNKSLGETLLHRSARNNRLDVVRFCLESDACDVNARDNASYTPLHECSSRGNLEVARLLLEHSADVNASATGGIRPLHDAIENNHIELVRLLLSYGADPNISTYSGSTPLQLCRSKTMFKFLKGFYSDITTERRVIDSTTLAWKFRNQPSENGFDVFADVPSDGEECQNTFYFSENPLVPLYSLMHNSSNSFYLLCDVLETTGLSQAEFILKYADVEISKISKTDLAKATLSQLEQRVHRSDNLDQEDDTNIIYQNARIDDILHISTTVIS